MTTNAGKAELYRELAQAIGAITAGEPDAIANMANAAALLWEYLPDINWVGFYRVIDGELVLGPFQGKVACIRIALGAGVCGTAAASGTSQLVDDVHAFPGHIACDAASAAELVVPIVVAGRVIAVLDIDSPTQARFDEQDRNGVEAITALLATRFA
jgi:GAF domain-containing protein